MVFTFLVFLHLIATCAAIGTIVVTDMRLAAKMMGYRVVIPRPERFETVMVSASLALLYLTGIALVAVALSDRPDYLTNGKLQAKLVLVGLLTLNAFILHFMAFPILALSRPVSEWTRSQWFTVAASVSLSNSLWFFCAFLGVARIWNFTVSAGYVLAVAAVVWTVVYLLVNLALKLGSRDAPRQQPDWVDSTIATLSDFARLAAARVRPLPIDTQSPSANQHNYGRRLTDRRADGLADRRRARRD
ncbi:MAG: hypothetical protein U1F00_20530 [Rhodoferax sp.]